MMQFHNRTVEIELPERRLEGIFLEPRGEGPFPGVIFYHGRASSMKNYIPIIRTLAEEAGICGLGFDFSTDEFAPRFREAEKAYKFLYFEPKVDRERIGICGVSMGAYQAVLVASENPVSSLLLRAPAAFPMSEKLVAFKMIRQFKGDLLIVESELDNVVPSKISGLYFDNAINARSKKLKVIKGASHFLGKPDSLYREEFKQIAVDWFSETLSPPTFKTLAR